MWVDSEVEGRLFQRYGRLVSFYEDGKPIFSARLDQGKMVDFNVVDCRSISCVSVVRAMRSLSEQYGIREFKFYYGLPSVKRPLCASMLVDAYDKSSLPGAFKLTFNSCINSLVVYGSVSVSYFEILIALRNIGIAYQCLEGGDVKRATRCADAIKSCAFRAHRNRRKLCWDANDKTGCLVPEHTAYLCSTSGSSGAPKLVCIDDRGLNGYCRWYAFECPGHPEVGDVVGLMHSPEFDAFHCTLWSTLMTNCPLVALCRDGVFDPDDVAWRVKIYGVTHLSGTPSMWRVLLSSTRLHLLSGLKTLYSRGEPFDMTFVDIEDWNDAGFKPRIINLYGPCEATNDVLFHEVTDISISPEETPLGTPVPGHVESITRRSDHTIVVQGPCVSLGYLGSGPFRADGAYVLPDNLEYKGGLWYYRGRTEHSDTKIAGHRMDIATLSRHFKSRLTVRDGIVHLLDTDAEKLQEWKLQSCLPRAVLECIRSSKPMLGKTGKVIPSTLDQTSLQSRMCKVILDLWNLTVGPDDDLLCALDSMKTVTLVHSWNSRLNLRLSVSDVFRTRTVRGCCTNASPYFDYDVMRLKLSPLFGLMHLSLHFKKDEGSSCTLTLPPRKCALKPR